MAYSSGASLNRLAVFVLAFFGLAMLCVPFELYAQTSGGVQSGEPTFHVVRSVSGSKGSQQSGRYVIQDPRSIFYTPADKEVIVYFEWDGPPGTHHFEGYWKNPEGKAVVISDFSFESKQKRFGGYWSLNLTDGTTPGVWSLEAHVDGEVTGSHTFQIMAAAKPANLAPSEPQLLTPSQIYLRALASTVALEKMSPAGERISRGAGFFIGDGLVLTAFQVIDGASSIRVQLPGGQRIQTNEVVGWNRWRDWALLKVPATDVPKLKRAQPNSWAVGDRCFFLNAAADGTRTIVNLSITGTNTYPNAGERLSLSSPASPDAVGSPLLNEYGNVVGIVGTGTIPGAVSLSTSRFSTYASVLSTKGDLGAGLALPISLVPESTSGVSPLTLADLAQRGQFVSPLMRTEVVGQGALALRLDNRRGVSPMPSDDKYEFSHKDQHFVVFVMWTPKEKQNATTAIRLYDLSNNLLMESNPSKLNLRPNGVSYTTWQMGMEGVNAGIYRLDVVLDAQPVWRTFFSIAD